MTTGSHSTSSRCKRPCQEGSMPGCGEAPSGGLRGDPRMSASPGRHFSSCCYHMRWTLRGSFCSLPLRCWRGHTMSCIRMGHPCLLQGCVNHQQRLFPGRLMGNPEMWMLREALQERALPMGMASGTLAQSQVHCLSSRMVNLHLFGERPELCSPCKDSIWRSC